MKSNVVILFAAGVFVVLLSLTLSARPQTDVTNDVRKWEHLALTVNTTDGPGDGETSRQIVQLGSEGWELVDVESLVKEDTTKQLIYCFKRPK